MSLVVTRVGNRDVLADNSSINTGNARAHPPAPETSLVSLAQEGQHTPPTLSRLPRTAPLDLGTIYHTHVEGVAAGDIEFTTTIKETTPAGSYN